MREIIQNPWTRLRSFTNARLALGRAGDSLPTNEVLEFALAHARARDAVHNMFDADRMTRELTASGFESITVQSAVSDRAEYLRSPDLGRKLNEQSRSLLTDQTLREAMYAVFIIADGLSAIAPERHAVPVLKEIMRKLEGWNLAPIIIATQARVALGDAIGELLNAEMTVMLIGERPGLSSPDSLGIYLTYKPHIGCTDADRNCISNVRPEGLSYPSAAHKLHHLMLAARRLGKSGIALKDESDQPALP
ncbi:ethanolamine ammonia-lyase subunit EutC [Alloacidobacterium dinghuense]|uniref:Ethanolamine ammonia-lyase small subunit n=1 Tax=Alloacidobacterium dinghuense TaxID=2763107 RepID=A0A7G8BIB8_9BACT|nr:ethanolamine ammonia-lyase subunit EutC [Alloacidobacterium dinghuense]QNI32288.1 ethanolamine ammonia-lyase subunit EutC [Alloacidobacterium dinghuense]